MSKNMSNNNRFNISKLNSQSTIIKELDDIRSKEKFLISELESVKKTELELSKKLDKDLKKDQFEKKNTYLHVKHFGFNDFAQIVIGVCVFSIAPFLDTDPWNYLPFINSKILLGCHLFFMLCVLIALNYEFRDNLKWDFWFFKLLIRRFFYTYFSVIMVVSLILLLVNQLTYSFTVLETFRHFLVIQSVGLFGATTYSFLKK